MDLAIDLAGEWGLTLEEFYKLEDAMVVLFDQLLLPRGDSRLPQER